MKPKQIKRKIRQKISKASKKKCLAFLVLPAFSSIYACRHGLRQKKIWK